MRPFIAILAALLSLSVVTGCGDGFEASEDLQPGDAYDDEGPPLVDPGKADSTAGLGAYAPLSDESDPAAVDFEALFAPGDPVHTVEMSMIQSVIDERATDASSYEEGKNPFRIRYAVYNLRNPLITGKLVEAERAGVDVQILIAGHQLDPEKTWNTADEDIVEAGLELVESQRGLTSAQRDTADMIGITGRGLMHLKARIFETPTSRVLYTGSLNPGDNAMLNNETVHVVRDPRLIDAYVRAYETIRGGGWGFDNQWDDAAPINVLYTPSDSGPRASTRILDWVGQEDELILLMVFSLRDVEAPGHRSSLVDILADKARSGVPVYVITDRKQSDGVDADGNHVYYDDRTDDRLRDAGVHVYEAINFASPFNAMHHKVAVLGLTDTRVITDTANWTKAGLGSSSQKAKNIESVLFVDSAKLDGGRTGRRYLAEWLEVLRRYAPQNVDEGEPSFEEVFDQLVPKSAWPMQPVVFSVSKAQTEFGEYVYVRGDDSTLGVWGAEHRGVRLDTDADTYPDWFSQPVFLPLGSRIQWKAVIGRPEGFMVQWEEGDNRETYVTPTPLLAKSFAQQGQTSAHGPWR